MMMLMADTSQLKYCLGPGRRKFPVVKSCNDLRKYDTGQRYIGINSRGPLERSYTHSKAILNGIYLHVNRYSHYFTLFNKVGNNE